MKQFGWRHYEVHILDRVLEFQPNLRGGIGNRQPAGLVYVVVHVIHVRAQMRGVIDQWLFFGNEAFDVAGEQQLRVRNNSQLKFFERCVVVGKQFKVGRNVARAT